MKLKAKTKEKATDNVVAFSPQYRAMVNFQYPEIPWHELGELTDKQKEEIAWAFPSHVNPGIYPTGDFLLIQYQRAADKVGAVYLPQQGKEILKANIVVARVLALGPLAYRNKVPNLDKNGEILRNPDGSAVFEEWPEGAHVRPGQFVRALKMAPDRWGVADPLDKHNMVGFGICRESDVIGVVIGNPMSVNKFWGHI